MYEQKNQCIDKLMNRWIDEWVNFNTFVAPSKSVLAGGVPTPLWELSLQKELWLSWLKTINKACCAWIWQWGWELATHCHVVYTEAKKLRSLALHTHDSLSKCCSSSCFCTWWCNERIYTKRRGWPWIPVSPLSQPSSEHMCEVLATSLS